jgi:Mg-chelatase subunit ChlD
MNDEPPTPSETLCSEKEFVLRPKSAEEYDRDNPRLEIHPLPDRESVMISIISPKAPQETISHVPCDIVLAIDVSGSMSTEAPAPAANPSQSERNGLTVLDLTKHAARTILENLDERDRLGIVTFSTEAKVVQQLLPMTKKNKKGAWDRIEKLKVESMTNLWHGILEGIKLFDDDERPNCVPAIMVLTDGLPNHMYALTKCVERLF